MKLIKYDNFYNDPYSEMDRWLDRAFSEFGRWPNLGEWPGARQFRMDIFSDEDNHYVVAELPGFAKDEVNVDLHNAVLTISAERRVKEGDREKVAQRFERSVTIGEDINAGKVKAKLENGLLTVTLPKLEERKPRTIKIA